MTVVDIPASISQAPTESTESTSVLIVDDHRSFAELLGSALDTVPGMSFIGIATSAMDGIARAVALKPDVIIMDIQMPKHDGLFATRRIREALPDVIIAVVTAHRDPEWIARAAQAGASAFIPKEGSLSEMIDVLQRVRTGQMLVAPSAFTSPPADSSDRSGQNEPAHIPLTQRESEVLTYLGTGLQTDGIAKILGVSVHTCRGYMKSLHSKLGVSTQLEAVIKAQALGLIGTPGRR